MTPDKSVEMMRVNISQKTRPNTRCDVEMIEASVLIAAEPDSCTIERSDGTAKMIEQVRVTAKGLSELAGAAVLQ